MRNTKGGKILTWKFIIISIMMFIFSFYLIYAQLIPGLHTIQGYIFNNGGSQAPAGTKVWINATTTGSFTSLLTSGPPGNTGFYSSSINASDGESIIVTVFNATAYGRNSTLLLNSPLSTRFNLTMNNTRPGETDINITSPSNGASFGQYVVFNVNFSITAIGGENSVNCNVTINISDENIMNITTLENKTKQLGNINLGNSLGGYFNIQAKNQGSSYITLTSVCSSDGINFENLKSETIGVSVSAQPPQMHTIQGYILNINNVTQVPTGTNVTINATTSGSYMSVLTSGPPGQTGFYSTTINAIDGEQFIVHAQNGTYEGTKTINAVNSPGTTRVNVTLDTKIIPDLFINFSDILFYGNLIENVNITVNATIKNIGRADVGNFTVQFFKEDPDFGGTLIQGNLTINNLSKGQSATLSVNYTTTIGNNNIFVLVDVPFSVNGSYSESNETNNKANNTLNITAWQTIYGNISIDKLIGDNSTRNISIWYDEQSFSGNVFISDTENTINWKSLLAIGNNLSGTNTTNDYSDLDALFNMTIFRDSVSNKFTTDGNHPRGLTSILAYQRNITNISVINSTNTSNFLTGILWDSSDDAADGEFSQDDKEDVVFFTNVNKGMQGAYGTYDYEISIPVRLREYRNNDVQNVFIYFDIN